MRSSLAPQTTAHSSVARPQVRYTQYPNGPGLGLGEGIKVFGRAGSAASEHNAILARSSFLGCAIFGLLLPYLTEGHAYELNGGGDPDHQTLDVTEISLFGVRLGDPERRARLLLMEEPIPGVKGEQVESFILLWDTKKPTGPMAGVRILDGKVDLIFINRRFAGRASGIFGSLLRSDDQGEMRDLAHRLHRIPGIRVQWLGDNLSIECTLP